MIYLLPAPTAAQVAPMINPCTPHLAVGVCVARAGYARPLKLAATPRELQRDATRRRKAGRRVLAGVDVDRAVAALRRLPVLAPYIPRGLVVRVRHGAFVGGAGGHARRWRICLTAGRDTTAAEVLELIVHELCHVAHMNAAPKCRAWHGERFRLFLRRALLQAWAIEIPIDLPRGAHGNRAYAMDAAAIVALELLISDSRADTFPPVD